MSEETEKKPPPSLLQRMAKLLRGRDPKDAAEMVPEGLMPHEALKKKEAQRKKMDEDTKE
jgi:hypothetical protein